MKIAITGKGIVCAIGKNQYEVWDNIVKGNTGIGPMKYLKSEHTELPVGEVKLSNAEMKESVGLYTASPTGRTELLSLVAIKGAIYDCDFEKYPGEKLCIISGTTVGGMDVTESSFLDHGKTAYDTQHNAEDSLMAQTGLFDDMFDEEIVVSTACSSAANAIMLGARYIRSGHADIVIAGGAEGLTRFHLNGFNSLMILDHEQCRPFDNTRAGLNLGEGAAYVVLESEEHALKRGVKPIAYVTGFGNACDAFHQTASSPNGEGAYLAMEQALREAHLEPSQIGYINAHGTGTPNNDESETAALKRVFADCKMPPVSSTKGFTGHTTSAAGAIEAVICLLAMEHGYIPPNLGWSEPMPGGITPTMGCPALLNHVMCNSFGFGGNDTSLIFSKYPAAEQTFVFDRKQNFEKVSLVEIDDDLQLEELSRFVKPLEMRRMGKAMRYALLSSFLAIEKAQETDPNCKVDAIITTAQNGCVENCEKILFHLFDEGETSVSPTLFMQSTHNTIGSSIARFLNCHGYNTTYVGTLNGDFASMMDCTMLLEEGTAHYVLLTTYSETTPLYRETYDVDEDEDEWSGTVVRSTSLIIKCCE